MTKRATPKNRIAPEKPAAAPAAGNGNGNGVLEARTLAHLLSSMPMSRSALAGRLGMSYGGDRDTYEALGYNKNPKFADYMARYRRQDIAKAVIDIPVRACWRKPPEVSEDEEDQTQFEARWEEIATRVKVWEYLSRVDRLASIGEYAVLLIGFNDSALMSQPVKRASDVLYLMPYSQDNAKVAEYVTDTKDPRYSLPLKYEIKMRGAVGGSATMAKVVHWSRVIHVSEDNLEDDMLGLPRLEALLNRLQDLDLVSGGSAEMFWRGAFPGFGLVADPGFDWDNDLPNIETQAENFKHKLTRYLILKGLHIENIAQQIADPTQCADLYMTLISAVTRIPKRILLGSELGQLASSQDEVNWYGRVDERREGHCESGILRPLVDRLTTTQVLPTPKNGYKCKWQPLLKQSEKDKAEVAGLLSTAISTYVTSGAETLMPAEFFFTEILGYDRSTIEKLGEMLESQDEEADGDGSIETPPPDPNEEREPRE